MFYIEKFVKILNRSSAIFSNTSTLHHKCNFHLEIIIDWCTRAVINDGCFKNKSKLNTLISNTTKIIGQRGVILKQNYLEYQIVITKKMFQWGPIKSMYI